MNKNQCEQTFSAEFNNQVQGLGATRSNIMRLLRSLDLVGWNTHEESGRLDRKAFTRFATGGTAIFSKRTHVEAEKSAVSVLIDCSGSMGYGGEIYTAQSIAIQLARILDKADVSFAVTGFNGGDISEENVRLDDKPIGIHKQIVNFIPFKTWGDSLNRASAKLGSINCWAGKSTPDYSALSLTIEDLGKREETRKILFLLTDADGYKKEHMQHLQSLADKLNIKLIAIGIGSTKVQDCFTHAENVSDVNDLASASFNKLLKELR